MFTLTKPAWLFFRWNDTCSWKFLVVSWNNWQIWHQDSRSWSGDKCMYVQTLEGTCELSNTWDGRKLANLLIPIFTLGYLSVNNAYVSFMCIYKCLFWSFSFPLAVITMAVSRFPAATLLNVVLLVKFRDHLFCFHWKWMWPGLAIVDNILRHRVC